MRFALNIADSYEDEPDRKLLPELQAYEEH